MILWILMILFVRMMYSWDVLCKLQNSESIIVFEIVPPLENADSIISSNRVRDLENENKKPNVHCRFIVYLMFNKLKIFGTLILLQ